MNLLYVTSCNLSSTMSASSLFLFATISVVLRLVFTFGIVADVICRAGIKSRLFPGGALRNDAVHGKTSFEVQGFRGLAPGAAEDI